MIDKLEVERLVSPAEAIVLFAERTVEDMEIVKELADAYATKPNKSNNLAWEKMSLLAFIWNAGRVQGIREERKKKAKSQPVGKI